MMIIIIIRMFIVKHQQTSRMLMSNDGKSLRKLVLKQARLHARVATVANQND